MLTDWPEAGIELEEKLSFFKETRHAYGRTALLLSGGGGLGSFHIVSGLLAGHESEREGRTVSDFSSCLVVRCVSILAQ